MERNHRSDWQKRFAQFCEMEEISRSAFASWKKKIGTVRKKSPAFVETTGAVTRKSPALPVTSPQTFFELALPGGATLRWKS